MADHEMLFYFETIRKEIPGNPDLCITGKMDFSRQCEGGIAFTQCPYPCGHGPKGAYCKQHAKRWEEGSE